MKAFFYKLPQTIIRCYKGYNLLWQFLFIILTYVLVTMGFDWFYYQSTRDITIQLILFPAVMLGFFIPIISSISMFIYGALKENKIILNTAYALSQAGILGLIISSIYKVFTGRMGPPHFMTNIDISHMFRLGFFNGGAFHGWPSSHTTVAFAMSMVLITLFPKNKIIRYCAIIYAFYIGIGVSVNIHWFSDFVAGAILGTVIGVSVGKSFLMRIKNS